MTDSFDAADHEPEARQRWGDTDEYRESARRTAAYTKADWAQIGREADEINQSFLELMARGTPAGETTATVDRHRDHISKWFYECTPEIHAGLGQMYIEDARFTENIDKAGVGLARYMADAIAARYRD
ncbi:MAG: TipAS antibiotic-recognition domain-containing protein [Acidimicrobiia bacterium]|nr:TipAS antibiotic-recognition domain-containing protein [Acidimicrobiia bacterium]